MLIRHDLTCASVSVKIDHSRGNSRSMVSDFKRESELFKINSRHVYQIIYGTPPTGRRGDRHLQRSGHFRQRAGLSRLLDLLDVLPQRYPEHDRE